jgi:N-succinyldiaminopimelate aminotransferase
VTGRLDPRLEAFRSTIFVEMSALAARTGAVNLGQGFPDVDGPDEVRDAAVAALHGGHNQYPPGDGVAELRRAVADHQRRFWGIEVDPDGEVLVTAGATEAIAAAVIALCGPGDEVVAFEPTYDSYAPVAAMAGARLRPVTLRAPSYGFDEEALRAAITPRTKVLLLNSPHNPTGKVFDDDELALIARLCVEHDLVAVTDEVYEHMVFEGRHVPLATLPDMADRTLTVSSAGKTFSFTGWKVGWVSGPRDFVDAVRTVKQFVTFVSGGPFQPAVAVGLGLPDAYFRGLRDDLHAKRDVLCDGLAAAGFEVLRPAGTYFVTVDIRPIDPSGDGLAFCRSLPERCGVVGVPTGVFYEDEATGRHLVRFAFCKRAEVLEEAVVRLKGLSS